MSDSAHRSPHWPLFAAASVLTLTLAGVMLSGQILLDDGDADNSDRRAVSSTADATSTQPVPRQSARSAGTAGAKLATPPKWSHEVSAIDGSAFDAPEPLDAGDDPTDRQVTPSMVRAIVALETSSSATARLESINVLWASASAFGLADEAHMALSAATHDPSDAVAELARTVLDDLDRVSAEQDDESGLAEQELVEDTPKDASGAELDASALDAEDDLDFDSEAIARALEDRIDRFEHASIELQMETLNEIARFAVDADVPERSLEFFDKLVLNEPDSELARLARRLRKGLERRWNELAVMETDTPGEADSSSNSVNDSDSGDGGSLAARATLDEDAAQMSNALSEDDLRVQRLGALLLDNRRTVDKAKVISMVAGYRTDEATALLVKGTVVDSPQSRLEAVLGLHRSIGDDIDELAVGAALQQATTDPDPLVSDAATAALEDLEALARTR